MKLSTKDLIIGALLTALTVIIPTAFKTPFTSFVFLPFTATLAAHVPLIIAMFINPFVALLVAILSPVGFLLSASPTPVLARASMHIVFIAVGAFMVKKRVNIGLVVIATTLIHGVCEYLVVLPFIGYMYAGPQALVTLCGTMAHHLIDTFIAVLVILALKRTPYKSIFGDYEFGFGAKKKRQ